jgi:allantoin racemase
MVRHNDVLGFLGAAGPSAFEREYMMPRALVVNPNTSQWMTKNIRESAADVFQSPWEFSTAQPPGGPDSIDSLYESGLAAVGMLDLLEEMDAADGVVIACFSDPGLFEFRELLDVPVVGVAEASFLAAIMISYRFGILGGSPKDIPWMESILCKYGLEKRCSGIQPMGPGYTLSGEHSAATLAGLVGAGKDLINRGAESLILGCAGWGIHRPVLENELSVPVIDPVGVACWQLKMLVELRLKTSKAGLFHWPMPKQMRGLVNILSGSLSTRVAERAGKGLAKE